MEKIIRKIFNSNKYLGVFLFILGFGLLIYVFSFHLENNLIAYIAYLLSTYALIIFIIWFLKVCRFINDCIKKRSKLYKIYNKNHEKITRFSLYFSLTINFIYGILKFASGLYYKSFWFITFSIYYLALCEMKLAILRSIKKGNIKTEHKTLRRTGIIILLLDLVLMGIIILINHQNQTITYPGYLIYIVALYDFYLIISAFINVFKYRRKNNSILLSSKCINLTVAMISMISLEVAMLSRFGNEDAYFKLIMITITGFVVAIINSLMALYMIIKSNKLLRKNV